jgi:hypothetical protein
MTIKKEWFDKIKSGEKTIEYREFKPFWISRLDKFMMRKATGRYQIGNLGTVVFKNGYSSTAPKLTCTIIDINIVDGKDTDLKFNGKVYAIHLFNVQ